MANSLFDDSGLPSNRIRQVNEIPGRCVLYEIPEASFLSISLSLFVGGGALAPGSYLCGEY